MTTIDSSHQNINLRTLKRVDDSIVDIEESASQVAVYKFASYEWERKEIEGTLFVVRRNRVPFHCFVVINRLNTTNMVEPITPQLDLKVQSPYLLYKNDKDDIYCVWFYDDQECTRVGKCMELLINNRFNEQNVESKLAHLGINVNHEHNLPTGIQTQIHDTGHDNGENILSILQKGLSNRQRNDSLSNGSNGCTQHEISSSNQKILDINHLLASATNFLQANSNPLLLPHPFAQENQVEHQGWGVNNSIEDVLTPESLSKQKAKPIVEDVQSPDNSPPIISQQPPSIPLYRPTPTPVNINQTPLTMEQLKQTLIYLLQNDADFLHAIHSAYANVLHK